MPDDEMRASAKSLQEIDLAQRWHREHRRLHIIELAAITMIGLTLVIAFAASLLR